MAGTQTPEVTAFLDDFYAWVHRVRTGGGGPSLGRGGRGCGTQAIGERMRNIKLLWKDLPALDREAIRAVFDVDDSCDPPLVNF